MAKPKLLADLSSQKAAPNTSVKIIGTLTAGDAPERHFVWNNDSLLVADGVEVIAVTGVTIGRWIQIAAGGTPKETFHDFTPSENSKIVSTIDPDVSFVSLRVVNAYVSTYDPSITSYVTLPYVILDSGTPLDGQIVVDSVNSIITLPAQTAEEIANGNTRRVKLVSYAITGNPLSNSAVIAILNGKQNKLTKIIFLSQEPGIVSDANVAEFSTTYGTDCYSAIQTVLNKALINPIKIIWDVEVSTSNRWIVYSDTIIETLSGCGAIRRPNANIAMWRTETGSKNITWDGGTWNLNGETQGETTTSGSIIVGFSLVSTTNVTIKNATILHSKAYHISGQNVDIAYIYNNYINGGDTIVIYNDGIHFDGPASRLTIEKNTIKTHDDNISLISNYSSVGGVISDVNILDNIIFGSTFGVRLLSQTQRIENITIRGLKGQTKGYAIVADNFWQFYATHLGVGNYGTINIDDIQVNVIAKGVTYNIHDSYMNFAGVFDAINITKVNRKYFDYNAPFIRFDGAYTNIKNISISTVNSIDASNTNLNPLIGVYAASVIDNLTINDVYVSKSTDVDSPVLLVDNGIINSLILSDIRTDRILNPIKILAGSIASINGSNIVHNNSDSTASFIINSITIPVLNLIGYKGAKASSGTVTNYSVKGTSLDYTLSSVAIGTNVTRGKLNVYEKTPLGTVLNNATLISTLAAMSGTAVSTTMFCTWLRRSTEAGTNWQQAVIHEGISIDGSFDSPGVNTRAWTERNASLKSFAWGSEATRYLELNATSLNPSVTDVLTLGTAAIRWSAIYGNNLVIGASTQIFKLTINDITVLGTNLNDIIGRSSIGGVVNDNNLRSQIYHVRNTAAGSDWNTVTIYNTIDVDGAFSTLATFKSWWSQNPSTGEHAWGNGSTTYMRLTSASLFIASIIGGITSGGNLTLSSTSHATKGKIIFGASAYDEVNNRLGVGLSTPLNTLHVANAILTASTEVFPARFSDAGGAGVVIGYFNSGAGAVQEARMRSTGGIPLAIGVPSVPQTIYILTTGLIGIQVTAPTAKLHIVGGGAAAGNAPLKINSGTDLTTPEVGAFEFSFSRLAFTPLGTTRKRVVLTNDVVPSNGQILIGNGTDFTTASLIAGSGITITPGAGSLTIAATVPIQLFDNYTTVGNSGTTETDLATYTTTAGRLANNGDKIFSEYGGMFVSSGTATRQVKMYFGGSPIFDSGALSISTSASWSMNVLIIRVSSTVIRYKVELNTQGASLAAYTSVGEVTGLTLSNTNILKVTGTAAGVGAASNDITLMLGTGRWIPAA